MSSPLIQQNSLTESGFNTYIKYLALKRHFTSSYDYHKYNGKVKASYENFIGRRDAHSFQRLSKKKDVEGLILSNIILKPKIWVGDLLDDSAKEVYLEWKKKQDSITHHVKESLHTLDSDFKSNFIVEDGQYPHIVELYLGKKISLETLCIVTKLTNSQPYWKNNVTDKVIFPDILTKVDNYHPFINYSPEKMKKAIKDRFF